MASSAVSSLHLFIANWTSFFTLKPLVDAARVVFVGAGWQLFDHLPYFKILKANCTSFFICVVSIHPNGLLNWVDHFLIQSFANFTISILELKKFFIAHGVWIRVVGVSVTSAGLYGLLQHSLFFLLNSWVPLGH